MMLFNLTLDAKEKSIFNHNTCFEVCWVQPAFLPFIRFQITAKAFAFTLWHLEYLIH
jgi:hypothetical protein